MDTKVNDHNGVKCYSGELLKVEIFVVPQAKVESSTMLIAASM